VVDNFFSKSPIKNFDNSEQEGIFLDFMAAGGNYNMKFEPAEKWSSQWLDWSKRY
jgi:hypothetical protein